MILSALLSFLTLIPSAPAHDLDHLPRAFSADGKKAVFVDFSSAVYDLTYTLPTGSDAGRAQAVAEMTFENIEEGYPLFDCESTPTRIELDGREVSATLITTPAGETQLRRVELRVPPGAHTLRVELPIEQLVELGADGVKSGFFMTDLRDRGYLERYLPTNLLFDRIPMKFRVHFQGGATNQKIYSNGLLRQIDSRNFEIEFPAYFQASSLYFHTTPATAVRERRFEYTTIGGKILPVTIYTAAGANAEAVLDDASNRVRLNLQAMEADFGDFPHPSLTVYIASGGMEYCGATMTSLGALSHELFHSYFARGIMPADGNSGWIDEALAVWHDVGFTSLDTLDGSSRMASHPYYTRSTDTDAYSFGKDFIRYLNAKFSAQGGLKPFLRKLLAEKLFTPITTEEFYSMMGAYYGVSVEADFKRYVYGTSPASTTPRDRTAIEQLRSIPELRPYL